MSKLTSFLSALPLLSHIFFGGKSTIIQQEAHLENSDLAEADLMRASLEGAFLMGANLTKAYLNQAHLEGANLRKANMKKAILIGANLEGANLEGVNLEGALLNEAHLEGANLRGAHLEGADLRRAHLEGADLEGVNLEGANLQEAILGGMQVPNDPPDYLLNHIRRWKSNFPAVLQPTNLRKVFFDNDTNLKDIRLGNSTYGFVLLADIHWNGVNLAVVRNWTSITMIGDEREARFWRKREPDRKKCLRMYQQALRANRQLAATLQDQGMHEEADHFAYRAQVLHRQILLLQLLLRLANLWEKTQKTWLWKWLIMILHWFQRTGAWQLLVMIGRGIHGLGTLLWKALLRQLLVMIGRGIHGLGTWLQQTAIWWLLEMIGRGIHGLGIWLYFLGSCLLKLASLIFSVFLSVLAGYGYRPERSVFWYLFVVFSFATIYTFAYHFHYSEAFFLSLTSFHGRGFFPGPADKSLVNSPIELLAAIEAIIGLFIEISFIAAFTRRYLN